MEMQAQGVRRADGLDLKAVQDIAREIGVDVNLVELAAKQLGRGSPGALMPFVKSGSQQRLQLAHEEEKSPEQIRDLIAIVRRVIGQQGETKEVMGSVEWKTVGDPHQTAVTFGTGESGTTVDVFVESGSMALLIGVVSVGLGLVTAVATGAVLQPGRVVGIALLLGGATGGVALARVMWTRSNEKLKEKLQVLADALHRQLES